MNSLKDISIFITLISVIATFFIGIINLLESRKNKFRETITTGRITAYREMREYISLFVARNNFFISLLNQQSIDEDYKNDVIKEIEYLKSSIRMRLTKGQRVDDSLYKDLGYFPVQANTNIDYNEVLNRITENARYMLKAEWEKIKNEAKIGVETKKI
jgi:hypothetical protein